MLVINHLYLQFVPFREFIGRFGNQNASIAQSSLAKEVLAEIPEQFISYMKAHNIQPRQIPSGPPPQYS